MKNTTITVILMVTTIIFANTIHVPGDYTTIQGGIDASVNGDTVFVSSGTYVENIDFNGKSISLIGEETETTIIDGDSLDTVVKIINGENASTLLRGFTITNGNTIEQGGGIKVANYSSPTIMNCNIQYNNNNSESSGAMGAGIHCGTNSTPMIINCSINNNYGKCGGGGIGVDSNASPIFKNCNIFNNITEGSSQYHGAAVFAWGGHPTFVNCTIYENQSSGNQDGLAIINGSLATISNCTIVKHEKPTIGTWGGGSMAIILNSIIRDGSGEYIISGGLDVSYSNIDGGYEGNGNVDTDPLFVDANNDDYNLQSTSPCINTGSNSAFSNDIDGTRNDMGYTGGSGIIIEKNSIPFGYVASNAPISLSIKLMNYSTNTIIINSSSTNNDQFNVATSLPVTINQSDNLDISFSYTPIVEGASEGEISFDVSGLYGATSAEFNVSGYGIIYTSGIIRVPEIAPTIHSAILISVSGDTILVSDGEYYETISMAGKNIVLMSENGPENTIINGTDGLTTVVLMSGWGAAVDNKISGFTIKNGNYGIYTDFDYGGRLHTVENCIVSDNTRGIHAQGPGQWQILNTLFIRNDFGFSNGYYGHNCTIVNSTFDNTIDIEFTPGYGTTVGLDIYNSILTGQINGADLNPINLYYCNYVEGNLGTNANDIEGNIIVNPLFVDIENNNYNLSYTSPCINSGHVDLDGDGIIWETDEDDQDPDATRMDMGAYYLHHTTFSFPQIELLTGDTTLIPLSLDFHPDSSFSSAAITITGYQDQIEFLGIESENSLTGDASWMYQSNESDSLGIVWSAGSTGIPQSGVFCYFKFYVPITTSSGIVPLSIVSAYLDEDLNYPTIINSGEISVYEIAYGDVSQNGVISPYDASLILKYLTETDSLSDQQMLNANVSLDESISALDASLILQYGVGIIESLPYDTTMGSLLAVGDIGMEDGAFTMGEIVEVPLYLTNGSNILSFETEISFDADVLIFSDIIWSDGLGEFTIESNLTDGNLLFAGAGSLPDGQNNVLATLQFTLNENFSGTETTVSMNQIRFNENEIIVNGASATLTEVLSVDDIVTPEVFALHQNYPNPFNPTTTLRYDLPEDSQVKIMIYDLMGREVKSLVNIQQNAGYKAVVWDATNNLGQPVSAGMYLYRISAGDFYSVKKMVLLK